MTDDRRDQLAEACRRLNSDEMTGYEMADELMPTIDRLIEAEAARWQAKIEAPAKDWLDHPFPDAAVFAPSSCARRIRALLDGEKL